jgi:hypothetical protein
MNIVSRNSENCVKIHQLACIERLFGPHIGPRVGPFFYPQLLKNALDAVRHCQQYPPVSFASNFQEKNVSCRT